MLVCGGKGKGENQVARELKRKSDNKAEKLKGEARSKEKL